MVCDTQECRDAQNISPIDFLNAAKEMETCLTSSKDLLNKLSGNQKMKAQVLALDLKTNKIINEGRTLFKKTNSKGFKSKAEIMKIHKRLLEITWEIRHNLKERQALLKSREKTKIAQHP